MPMRLLFLLMGFSFLTMAQGPEQAKYLLNKVSTEIKTHQNYLIKSLKFHWGIYQSIIKIFVIIK